MSAVMRISVAGAGLIGRKQIELIEASPDCVVAGIADPILINLVHDIDKPYVRRHEPVPASHPGQITEQNA
jgi:hypothetical protein